MKPYSRKPIVANDPLDDIVRLCRHHAERCDDEGLSCAASAHRHAALMVERVQRGEERSGASKLQANAESGDRIRSTKPQETNAKQTNNQYQDGPEAVDVRQPSS